MTMPTISYPINPANSNQPASVAPLTSRYVSTSGSCFNAATTDVIVQR